MSSVRMLRFAGIAMALILCLLILGLSSIRALPKPTVTCTTDKSAYIFGDTVLVSGQVSSSTGVPLAGAIVWLVSSDPSGVFVENTKKSSGSNGTFSDTFSLPLNATEGNYTLSVSATAPNYQTTNCQNTFTVAKWLADFAISVSPSAVTIGQGESANYTVLVSSSTNFRAPVTLSIANNPLSTSATFSPDMVTAGNVSVLTVATTNSTVLGDYSMTINGGGGLKSHMVEVNLTVAAPFDFHVSLNSTVDTIIQGSIKHYAVNVTMWGVGSIATVTLSLLGGPPFSNHLFSPVNGTTSFKSILTIVTSASTIPGQKYQLVVTASGAGKTRSASAKLTVLRAASPPPFNFVISATPSGGTIVQEMTAYYTISVVGSGTPHRVTLGVLSEINHVTTTLSPEIAFAPFIAVLSVGTNMQTTPSTYVLSITGSAGSVVQTAEVTVVVVEPDFSLSVVPEVLKLEAGRSVSATVNVQPIGNYLQPITLSASSTAGSTTAAIQPSSGRGSFTAALTVTLAANATFGNYGLLISALSADGKLHSLLYQLYLPIEKVTSFGSMEVLSNSTVTGLTVGQNSVSYTVKGSQGTPGFSNTTLPIALLNGTPAVTIDGKAISPVLVAQNHTHYMIYLIYNHASQQSIRITGTTPIPEFPNQLLLILTLGLLTTTRLARRKRRK